MTAVRAVLFDVGGTLAGMPEIELGARLAAALGHGTDAATRITDLVLRNGFTSAHALAGRLQAELGFSDEPVEVVRELWDAERAGIIELPDATACVGAVAAAGAKVGLVANLSTAGVEGFRAACPGIVSALDAWTVSCEHGDAKPSPTIFQAACAALAVDPAHVLMIGDRLDLDVVPARALGMSAIWLRRDVAGAAHVVTVDPHAAGSADSGEMIPAGVVVARTLSQVRRMALTWLWADRGRHGLTGPLAL